MLLPDVYSTLFQTERSGSSLVVVTHRGVLLETFPCTGYGKKKKGVFLFVFFPPTEV